MLMFVLYAIFLFFLGQKILKNFTLALDYVILRRSECRPPVVRYQDDEQTQNETQSSCTCFSKIISMITITKLTLIFNTLDILIKKSLETSN